MMGIISKAAVKWVGWIIQPSLCLSNPLPIGCDFLGSVEGIEIAEVGRDQVLDAGRHVEKVKGKGKVMSCCGTDL